MKEEIIKILRNPNNYIENFNNKINNKKFLIICIVFILLTVISTTLPMWAEYSKQTVNYFEGYSFLDFANLALSDHYFTADYIFAVSFAQIIYSAFYFGIIIFTIRFISVKLKQEIDFKKIVLLVILVFSIPYILNIGLGVMDFINISFIEVIVAVVKNILNTSLSILKYIVLIYLIFNELKITENLMKLKIASAIVFMLTFIGYIGTLV